MKIKYLILGLALAVLLSGCSQPAAPTEQTQTPPPSAGVQQPPAALHLAVERSVGFDPYVCQSTSNRLVLSLVTQPLFAVSETGDAIPVLAKGWAVSPDGMTTTVYLREDVLFHDGSPLSPSSVISSIQRAAEGTFYAERFRFLASVTAAGDDTVVFRTQTPYECFPLLLDVPIVTGTDPLPVGTGPYMWDGTEGLKQAGTWTGDFPSGQDIGFVSIADSFSLRDTFQYGGISAAAQDPNAPGALGYSGDYELWSVPTTILQYIGFNLSSGAFSSGALRNAVTYAIDREAIVREDMDSFGVPTVLPALPGSRTDVPELSSKVTYAPHRLRDVANGISCRMIVGGVDSQKARSAQRIARQLEACGMTVELSVLSEQDFRKALSRGSYDLYYAETRLAPDMELASFFRTGGPLAYGGLEGTEALLELCQLTRANGGNAYDLHKTILTDGILCPIAFKHTALYLHRGAFSGISPKLGGWMLTYG